MLGGSSVGVTVVWEYFYFSGTADVPAGTPYRVEVT